MSGTRLHRDSGGLYSWHMGDRHWSKVNCPKGKNGLLTAIFRTVNAAGQFEYTAWAECFYAEAIKEAGLHDT